MVALDTSQKDMALVCLGSDQVETASWNPFSEAQPDAGIYKHPALKDESDI